MSVLAINQQNFNHIITNTPGPILVDFWADWCAPCRMLSPIIEQLAEEHPEITVLKVNVDENPQLTRQFHIMGIPALLVFKNGQLVGNSVGFQSKDALEELVR